LRRTAWWSRQDSNLQTIGGTGGFQKTETALSRVSGGKAAEGQRLFRRRQETGIAQDCVVELVGLELATERLCHSLGWAAPRTLGHQ
jgi:hypothetical protein